MSDDNDDQGPATSRTALPQRIGPAVTPQPPRKPRGKTFKRLLKVVLILLILAAVAMGGLLAYGNLRPATDEDKVETAIKAYMTAAARGDLDALRDTTCGKAHEYYSALDETQFAAIYNASRDSIPVVDDVKRVDIMGDRALAEVSAHTKAHAQQTVRTVGLERVGGEWKVCDTPVGPGE